MSLKYESSSEPLHISVKQFLNRDLGDLGSAEFVEAVRGEVHVPHVRVFLPRTKEGLYLRLIDLCITQL